MNKVKVSFRDLQPIISETISRGDSFTFTAFGNSMKPTIRGGMDRVTLSPIDAPIKKNDILFYQRDNGDFILHRAIRVSENQILFCGDNQYGIESITNPNAILAKLTCIERDGKAIKPDSFFQRLYVTLLPMKRAYLRFRSKIINRFKI